MPTKFYGPSKNERRLVKEALNQQQRLANICQSPSLISCCSRLLVSQSVDSSMVRVGTKLRQPPKKKKAESKKYSLILKRRKAESRTQWGPLSLRLVRAAYSVGASQKQPRCGNRKASVKLLWSTIDFCRLDPSETSERFTLLVEINADSMIRREAVAYVHFP